VFIHTSRKSKLVIMQMPTMKKMSFKYLLLGFENSSTITSEHEIYTNVPAAIQENIISGSSLFVSDWRIHPIMTPTGVNTAKTKIMAKINLSYPGKVFDKLMPRDIAAAPLWRIIAMLNT
jgi:hypothetical protein